MAITSTASIRGSALNHGGKTNGYTVPESAGAGRACHSPGADGLEHSIRVMCRTSRRTAPGTKLGDPIEIAALSKAFDELGREVIAERVACRLCRSAPPNRTSATASRPRVSRVSRKVLLQMKHRQLVPSLHSRAAESAHRFRAHAVRRQSSAASVGAAGGRRAGVPRIAGISSFGAGGSNAHVVVENMCRPLDRSCRLAR